MDMGIHIIGTSHIAKQSIEEIKHYVGQHKPDIIAVELDAERAYVLMHEKEASMNWKAIFQVGVKGYLFAKIGRYVQQKLGKNIGIAPGSEMKTALELAKKEKIRVALIDQPIKITLRNFSKNLTWREKFRFLGDISKGILMPKKQLKKYKLQEFDLAKVPEDKLIGIMMEELRTRYLSIYKSLVEDRNKYMVKKLVTLLREDSKKNILVVVGAGHKSGMEELLLKVDIIN
jgi:pheromone shutdown-related protein TraB